MCSIIYFEPRQSFYLPEKLPVQGVFELHRNHCCYQHMQPGDGNTIVRWSCKYFNLNMHEAELHQ